MHKISKGFKILFFPMRNILANSLINSWNFRKWNIFFIMLSSKCGGLSVHSPSFFQTLKLKLGHNFPHSSADSELGLRNLGFRLYFQVLTIHKEIEQFTFPNIWKRLKVGIFYCKSSPLLSYFVILYLGRVG